MTIVAACKVSEGLVLGADSRLTIVRDGLPVYVSDNETKLLPFRHLPAGILTCGSRAIAGKPVASWLTAFSRDCPPTISTITDVATALADYLPAPDEGNITAIVAGYDRQAGLEDGRIFTLNLAADGSSEILDHSGFFYRLDGDFDAVTRLLEGRSHSYVNLLDSLDARGAAIARQADEDGTAKASPPLYAMTLRDGVDLVDFWLRTQIDYQRFSISLQTCGYPIDIAIITPEGFSWVRSKDNRG